MGKRHPYPHRATEGSRVAGQVTQHSDTDVGRADERLRRAGDRFAHQGATQERTEVTGARREVHPIAADDGRGDDADDPPPTVEEGATRVSWIDGNVVLHPV